jgi:hypothetical protein
MATQCRWNLVAAVMVGTAFAGALARAATPPPAATANPDYQPPRIGQRPPNFQVIENRGGRILVELDISATGKVLDARIAEGGYGQKYYADRVLRWLKATTFEPARRNGEAIAVQGLQITQPISITSLESNGQVSNSVSASFQGRLDKAIKLIKGGDNADADAFIRQMLHEHVTSTLEYCEMHHQLAFAYANTGKVHEALLAARAALDARLWTPEAPVTLPKALGELHMQLAASQGMLPEALREYSLLGGAAALTPSDAGRAEEWKSVVASSQPLRAKIRLTTAARWTQELSRKRFTVDSISGSLTGATLYCPLAGGRQIVALASGVVASIPENTRGIPCQLTLSGTPGTEFEIVEFPDGTAGSG